MLNNYNYRNINIIGNNGNDIIVKQRKFDKTAIGHEKSLITHKLVRNIEFKRDSENDGPDEDECNVMKEFKKEWRAAKTKEYNLNEVDLLIYNKNKYHPKLPYINIEVDKTIISGHNDIYDPDLLNFMRRLVVMSTQEIICANQDNP